MHSHLRLKGTSCSDVFGRSMFDIDIYQKKAEIQILLFRKGQNVGCLYWKGDSLTP